MFLGIKDDKKIIWFLKPKTYPNPAPCLNSIRLSGLPNRA